MLAIYNGLFLAFLLAFSHGLLKWISAQEASNFLEKVSLYWWQLGLAIGIYVFIFFYYAYLLQKISLSALYPAYTGLSIVLVAAVGALIFDEAVTIYQVIGILLIILGVLLVTSLGPQQ
jgi:small multidrug resistance pump